MFHRFVDGFLDAPRHFFAPEFVSRPAFKIFFAISHCDILELVQLHLLMSNIQLLDLYRTIAIPHTPKRHEASSEDVKGETPPEKAYHYTVALLPLHSHLFCDCLEELSCLGR